MALLLAFALAGPPSARADFGAPLTLGAGTNPEIASDLEGDSIAVWEAVNDVEGQSHSMIYARRISRDGALGPLITLFDSTRRDAGNPQVTSDADGTAYAVWETFDGTEWQVKAHQISSNGTPKPIRNPSVSGRDARNPQIAGAAAGEAVVVWEESPQGCRCVRMRSIERGLRLGPLTTLSPAGVAHAPRIVSDADGDAIAAWPTFDGSNWRVEARSISQAGAKKPLKVLSVNSPARPEVEIASDSRGNGVAVWTLDKSANGYDSPDVVQARSISRSGVLGPTRDLSALPADSSVGEPGVASDGGGGAVAVWSYIEGVQARSISAAGALGPIQDLFHSEEEHLVWGADPQIASDGDGDAVAVWRRGIFYIICGRPEECSDIEARSVPRTGALGPVQAVSDWHTWIDEYGDVYSNSNVSPPQIASDAQGDVVAVWADNFDGTVKAALGP